MKSGRDQSEDEDGDEDEDEENQNGSISPESRQAPPRVSLPLHIYSDLPRPI